MIVMTSALLTATTAEEMPRLMRASSVRKIAIGMRRKGKQACCLRVKYMLRCCLDMVELVDALGAQTSKARRQKVIQADFDSTNAHSQLD